MQNKEIHVKHLKENAFGKERKGLKYIWYSENTINVSSQMISNK